MHVNKSYHLLCEQYYLTCATARIGDIRKLRYQINGVGEYNLQRETCLLATQRVGLHTYKVQMLFKVSTINKRQTNFWVIPVYRKYIVT